MRQRPAAFATRRRPAVGILAAAVLSSAASACAADDAWRYLESPLVPGPDFIPVVHSAGPSDRGWSVRVECRGFGPSFYVTVNSPSQELRQLPLNTPVAVAFRVERSEQSRSTPVGEARVNATHSEGYLAHTNRIVLGFGLDDGAAVAALLGRDTGPGATSLVIQIGRSSARLPMTGAQAAFARLAPRCADQRKR